MGISDMSQDAFAPDVGTFDILDSCTTGNHNVAVVDGPNELEQQAEEESQGSVVLTVDIYRMNRQRTRYVHDEVPLYAAEDIIAELIDQAQQEGIYEILVGIRR